MRRGSGAGGRPVPGRARRRGGRPAGAGRGRARGPARGGGSGSSGSNSGRESSNTYPQDHGPASRRAAPPATRCPDPHDSNGNPESTVPQWRTALSLRDTSTSSLRSEVTGNQTGPDRSAGATRDDGPPPAGVAAVRSGPVREEAPGRRVGPGAGSAAAGGGPKGDVGDAPERPSEAPRAAERVDQGRAEGAKVAQIGSCGLWMSACRNRCGSWTRLGRGWWWVC